MSLSVKVCLSYKVIFVFWEGGHEGIKQENVVKFL